VIQPGRQRDKEVIQIIEAGDCGMIGAVRIPQFRVDWVSERRM
jgi:hypothetical protein